MANTRCMRYAVIMLAAVFILVGSATAQEAQAVSLTIARPIACPMIYAPVCASDGKTYSNDCEAKASGVYKWTSGECPESKPEPETIMCPAVYAPVCGADGETHSNACQAEVAGVKIVSEGECPSQPIACTKEYAPVCGFDGKTYSNSCMAEAAGMYSWKQGECVNPHPAPCPKIYRPVCGSDGVTYSNECLAKAAHVRKFRQGVCPKASACKRAGEVCLLVQRDSCGCGMVCRAGPVVRMGQVLGTCYLAGMVPRG